MSGNVKKCSCRVLAAVVIAGLWALPVTVLARDHNSNETSEPRLAEGTGSVHGKVTARPHKDYLRRAKDRARNNATTKDRDDHYSFSADDGKMVYNDTMVNYERIDVYAILLNPAAKPGRVHEVQAENDGGLAPPALAVAKGDVIRIENDSSNPLTFFLANINGDDIQDLPELAPGATADMTVELVGDLELARRSIRSSITFRSSVFCAPTGVDKATATTNTATSVPPVQRQTLSANGPYIHWRR